MCKTVIVILALFAASPAPACTFGGPCGDQSPYDRLFQHDSDSDSNLGWSNEGPAPPSYSLAAQGRRLQLSRAGLRQPSFRR